MGCFILPLTHLLGIYRRGLPWAVKPEGFAHNNYVLLTGLFWFISLRDSFASLCFHLSIATKVIKTTSALLCLWWHSDTVVLAGPCKARTAKESGQTPGLISLNTSVGNLAPQGQTCRDSDAGSPIQEQGTNLCRALCYCSLFSSIKEEPPPSPSASLNQRGVWQHPSPALLQQTALSQRVVK